MFNVEKVYTVLNADEVRAGSKGYFADDLETLEKMASSADTLRLLEKVNSKKAMARFRPLNGSSCCLFYLVEEPHEKKFRPYKDTDEMIEDFKKRYNSYAGWNGKGNPMYCPLIWIKHKDTQSIALITSFSKINSAVTFANSDMKHNLGILFEQFVYLDGSPCGIEE